MRISTYTAMKQPNRNDAWSMKQVREGLPLFFVSFMWSFGSGAIQLARPLFAFSLTDSILFVALMTSITGTARIISSPLTGYLTDRFGRKPLVITGAAIRAVCSLGQFFVESYTAFLVLEFFAQAGVSIFSTSITVLVSDVTSNQNRGRFMAVRTLSGRFGQIAGPATGGLIAALMHLQHIFLFDAITKLSIVAVVLFMIGESHKTSEVEKREKTTIVSLESFKPFTNRTFIALGAAAIAGALMQQGITYTVVPIHAIDTVGVDSAGLGALVSTAALLGIIAAYPNGIISDRFGRKFSLTPGLLVLAIGASILALNSSYTALFLAIVAFGIGEGVVIGTTQAFVMDLAPNKSRGTFLGVWSLVRNLASVVIPIGLGFLYETSGPQLAFIIATIWLIISAILVITLSRETAGRGMRSISDPDKGS